MQLLEARLAGVKRIPLEKALRASTTHRHDYLTAYIADLGNVVRYGRHPRREAQAGG